MRIPCPRHPHLFVVVSVLAVWTARTSTASPTLAAGLNGSTVSVLVRSVYPDRPFTIEALSPSRTPFEVRTGTTDSAGLARAELTLLPPERVGLDLALRVTLRVAEGQTTRSPWAHLALDPGRDASGFALTRPEVPLLPEPPLFLATAFLDIEEDGDPDLVGLTDTHAALLTNDGAGHYTDEAGARLGEVDLAGASTLAVADANGDGLPDILVLTGASRDDNVLLVNDGAGGFAPADGAPAKAAGASAYAAVFADLDGDGDADLFVANGISGAHGGEATPQRNALLFNDGSGTFSPSADAATLEALAAEALSRAVAAGDVDDDGDLDILVGNSGANQLLINDGAGNFDDASDALPPAEDSTYGVALVDVDLDGDLDVAYANTAFDPFAQGVLINQGGTQGGATGHFEVGEFPAPVAGQSAVRLGLHTSDVDADGDVDVLFAIHDFGSGERADLYLNQGGLQGGEAGTFALDDSFLAPSGVYSAIESADVDADGDLDLLLSAVEAAEVPSGAPTFLLLSPVFSGSNAPLGFLRGDVNGDLRIDTSDALGILTFLFRSGDQPECLAAADVNDSSAVDTSDAIALLAHLFIGGPQPGAPFPAFGDAASPLDVPCERVAIFAEEN